MQGKKTGKVQGPDPKVGVYVGEGSRWGGVVWNEAHFAVGFAADIDDLVYVRWVGFYGRHPDVCWGGLDRRKVVLSILPLGRSPVSN